LDKTISDLLGCDFPIVAFTHCRDVVAAVTNAGGFGVFGATTLTPEQLDIELNWIDERVGGKSYGIDILMPAKYQRYGGADKLTALLPQGHVDFVESLMRKYDVPPLPQGFAGYKGLRSENPVRRASELLDVAFEHRVRLLASALGSPPPELVERAHDNGVLVTALAGNAKHAEHHKTAGVDMVVAQGYEAGGHTGEITTMVLVPEVVDAVGPLPVLAAGGIGCGRQVAAAMALGAAGVWTGSIWTATSDAETHPVVKERLLLASSSDTLRSRCITGKTVRVLRSAWTDEWEDPDTPDPLPMPLQSALVSNARARIDHSAKGLDSGPSHLITNPVGQIVGRMNSMRSAREIVLDMVEEFVQVLEKFAEVVNVS
jgi:NAD(P)H-dependent flavin oxidoreductase YrpB (nitropropane dioxygenase family)